MSTRTYRGNVLMQSNTLNFPNGLNGSESTTILVRLAPDSVTLDIPLNRATTWNVGSHSLYQIDDYDPDVLVKLCNLSG